MTKLEKAPTTAAAPAEKTKPQRTPDELRKALQLCEIQSRGIKASRKATSKDYGDQLKNLEIEMTDLLAQLENLEG